MATFTIKESVFKEFISVEKIREVVKRVAAQINKDYEGKTLLFLGVLAGAAPFLTDLVREITLDCEVDFIKTSSYSGFESGELKMNLETKKSLKGRHVLLVEDILETGKTLKKLEEAILQLEPASLELCVFCQKPACLKYDVKPKYLGMELPDLFLIGYGLDYDEKGRHLPSIYILDKKAES